MVNKSLNVDLPEDPSLQSTGLNNYSTRQWLLLVYGILTLVVLSLTIFLFFIWVSPSKFVPPPNETLPPKTAPSNTLTETVNPTLRATFTPKPSHTHTTTPTSTNTPTNTPPPSLTPAFPFIDDDRYYLLDWTPLIAFRTIDLLEAYPNTLSTYARGKDNGGYFAAFSYAAIIQREALLRFPDARQADDWYWRLIFNLARTGDETARDAFTDYITQKLNNERVRLDELGEWGNTQQPPVQIIITSITVPTGYLSNNIIQINAEDNGGAIFWLLEKPDSFIAYPLYSYLDFRFPTFTDFFASDLTGDGIEEVVIYHSPTPGSKIYPLPIVFDLSHQPPKQLPFSDQRIPDIGLNFRNIWIRSEVPEGASDLHFVETVFPACPVNIRHIYRWNGSSFEFINSEYNIEPTPQLLKNCSLIIDHAVKTWGLEIAIDLMESLIQSWAEKTQIEKEPYLVEVLDEWHFRLGLYYAFINDRDKAYRYMESIVTNPAIPDNDWIHYAKLFLDTFQHQRDIYQTCLLMRLCDPKLAFQNLVASFSQEDYNLAPTILQEAGVLIRSTGFFDFDGNGQRERWITLRHRRSGKLELWIIKPFGGEIKALFVEYINTNLPSINIIDESKVPPLIKVEPDIIFSLERINQEKDLVITHKKIKSVFSADLTQQALDKLEKALLTGSDPAYIRTELINLERSHFFTCNYHLCPKYLYLLGLANELSGNERRAIELYLQLWREYPSSPFTSIVRLKLGGGALPPTSTPTPISTETPTPTVTHSLTPTITGTEPAPLNSETPSATATETPNDNDT